jgi:hypothetical protein
MLRFLSRRDGPGLGPSLGPLIALALDTSRQLGSWLEALKNSDSKGPRYENDASRNARETARRQAEFLEKLRDIQHSAARPDGGAAEPDPR